MQKTLLLGASGLAREVLAVARADSSHAVLGILDDGWADMGESFDGVPILGPIERAIDYIDVKLLVCVGSGAARENIVGRLAALGVQQDGYTQIVDSSVRNPGESTVGVGSIILANVSVTAHVRIGSHVVLMPNVTLTHDDEVDDFATIAAGVSLGGGVRIGRAAYIGMNASVRQFLSVGAYSTLGMGAALVTELPEREVWAGVPATHLAVRDSVIRNHTDAGSAGVPTEATS